MIYKDSNRIVVCHSNLLSLNIIMQLQLSEMLL